VSFDIKEVTNKTDPSKPETLEQFQNPIKLSISKSQAEFVYELTYIQV